MDKESFRELQDSQPWTDLWTEEFKADPRVYAKFSHCLTNIAAKLGAILQRVEMADHYGPDYTLALNRHKDGTALAIIITSALQAANSYPGEPLDLAEFIESELVRRGVE